MTEWQQHVDALWADTDVDGEQRIVRMRELADAAPHPALGAFELGGAYDSGGHEVEADVEYSRAITEGLGTVDPVRAARMVIQHASTLRNLGRVEDAITMLRAAPAHPSIGDAPAVFLALALHSAGRSDEALRLAIETIEPTLPRYNRSVRAYAAALTEG
ncbi:tetratricopeptide repeat protein [Curtobacterium sp. MCPF17_052]|uniref:tetratricopeptide repeat protein n=1 Tax=Curtobacterium sp. MCPF17_052 TaxID=2175655 RepID=UPI000DAA58CD|nr:tetratricopeptide repeat protein [Curtobacterium sp. MCPF17_052]WIB14053.1 tetratricopeptide repeat protein [Curtobacterium sp. MCPF17_052]